MTRAARIYISQSALRNNLQQVRAYAPQSKILAMLKANGYGHGLEQVAFALPDVDALGVACLEEAHRLRDAGVGSSIVLMEGFFHADELPIIDKLQLEIVIHHWPQIEALEKYRFKNPVKVWLKIDTGMHRLGFSPDAATLAWQRLMACSSIEKPIGLMTHFARADQCDEEMTMLQLQRFQEVTKKLPGPHSVANSASILAWPQTISDWVRPGIMLYGISPFADREAGDFGLLPAMTLQSELIAIHDLQAGDGVGYGHTWICPEPMRVGVVAIGYGDGYPRSAGNGTPVLLNGEEVMLLGRVSMDMIAIDMRTQPQAKIGDPVVLWGQGLPIEKIMRSADISAYELVCGVITQRTHVMYE